MNSVQMSNIVEGKRRRVMSNDAVLAVVSNMLPKELTKSKKKALKVDQCAHSESSSDVKVSDTKGRTKAVPIQAKESTQERNQKPAEQVVTPSKVKITKAALKELINKHFIIIDEVEPSHPITKK